MPGGGAPGQAARVGSAEILAIAALLVLLWRWTLFCAEREMTVWGPVLEPMRRAAHPSEPQPATASSTRPDALPRPVRRAPRGVPADTKRRESRHAAQNAIGFCVCSLLSSVSRLDLGSPQNPQLVLSVRAVLSG